MNDKERALTGQESADRLAGEQHCDAAGRAARGEARDGLRDWLIGRPSACTPDYGRIRAWLRSDQDWREGVEKSLAETEKMAEEIADGLRDFAANAPPETWSGPAAEPGELPDDLSEWTHWHFRKFAEGYRTSFELTGPVVMELLRRLEFWKPEQRAMAIDQLANQHSERISRVEAQIDGLSGWADALGERVDAQVAALGKRLDRVEGRLNQRLGHFAARLDALDPEAPQGEQE